MDMSMLKEAAKRFPEDVSPPFDDLLHECGFDALCHFSRHFCGQTIYVPKLHTIFCQCLEKEVLHRFNGRNLKDLVQKSGFTERRIRRLIKDEQK